MNRVVRSTRVAIWERPPRPMIRSPSQKPGTARSAASAGRSLMNDHAHDGSPAHRGAGARHPTGAALAQRECELGAQLAPGLQVQRLVDRLVRHPPSLILGVVGAQPLRDLPRRPPLSQPVVDRVVQFPVRFQHTLLRPRPPRVRTILGGHRTIRTTPTIACDLPRHHRMMSAEQNTDPPARQPGRYMPGNHLPLLGCQFDAAHATPLMTVDHGNSHAIVPFSRWCTHPMTLSLLGRCIREVGSDGLWKRAY